MTLHCRVTRINMERLQLDLTCRSSDLADKEGKYRYIATNYLNCSVELFFIYFVSPEYIEAGKQIVVVVVVFK